MIRVLSLLLLLLVPSAAGAWPNSTKAERAFESLLTPAEECCKLIVFPTAAPTSGTSRGVIYYDLVAQKFKVSENNGAYINLIGSGSGGVSGLTSTRMPVAASSTTLADSGMTYVSPAFSVVTGKTFAVADLVSGQLVFPTTGGRLSGDPNLTWDGTNKAVVLGDPTATIAMTIRTEFDAAATGLAIAATPASMVTPSISLYTEGTVDVNNYARWSIDTIGNLAFQETGSLTSATLISIGLDQDAPTHASIVFFKNGTGGWNLGSSVDGSAWWPDSHNAQDIGVTAATNPEGFGQSMPRTIYAGTSVVSFATAQGTMPGIVVGDPALIQSVFETTDSVVLLGSTAGAGAYLGLRSLQGQSPGIELASHNGTMESPTSSVDGDTLGYVGFYGSSIDGATHVGLQAAVITALVDGAFTPGVHVPGKITVQTRDTSGTYHTNAFRADGTVNFESTIFVPTSVVTPLVLSGDAAVDLTLGDATNNANVNITAGQGGSFSIFLRPGIPSTNIALTANATEEYFPDDTWIVGSSSNVVPGNRRPTQLFIGTGGVVSAGGYAVASLTGINQNVAVCTGVACASTCTLHITGGIITSATGTCP